MTCDRLEVTGAPLRSSALREREQIRIGNSLRSAAREEVAFSAHKKLSETDNICEKAVCNFSYGACAA